MILTVSEYVTDKLIKNCIAFGFFLLGVVFGLALILAIYQIFAHLKAKKPNLLKAYEDIDPEEDEAIKNLKEKLYSLDTKISIEKFLFESVKLTSFAISEIAKEYTGGKKSIILNLGLGEKHDDLELSFDTDFSVDDFLIFVENTSDVVENTILSVTDKYNILVSSFLKFIGLGKSVREVTAKDVILYLNEKAQRKEQKLLKAVEKKEKQEEKAKQKAEKKKKKLENKKPTSKIESKFIELFRPKQKKEEKALPSWRKTREITEGKAKEKHDEKEQKENKLASMLKWKKKEKNELANVEIGEVTKISAFYKPINKVILEVVSILSVGLCVEARKLYGRGYTAKEVEEVIESAETLFLAPNSGEEGGGE